MATTPTDQTLDLIADLDEELTLDRTWSHWQHSEPDLAAYECLTAAARVAHRQGDPALSDTIIQALIRLAARQGHDEDRAAWAVLHLMIPARLTLARKLRPMGISLEDVSAEMWTQIKVFSLSRKPHAWALVLRGVTQRALVHDLGATGIHARTHPVKDETLDRLVETTSAPGREEDAARELAIVLGWARERNVISAADVALLLDLVAVETNAEATTWGTFALGTTLDELAAARGLSGRTVRRRCTTALQRLAQASSDYLLETA